VPGQLALRTFYALKPLIPRPAQVAARRLRARRIWRALGHDPLPPLPREALGYEWPQQAAACAIVTHDVELLPGQQNVPSLLRIEEDLGITSCWNFVVRRYPIDADLIASLRETGHEIGVHGVYHDGREYASPEEFYRRLDVMQSAARDWGAVGFRSPSLVYERSLLETISFRWDSSMPAWDPFQPKRGDCLTYLPFNLNEHCVELPVTLWQDFTLFEELQLENIDIWRKQSDFVRSIGGLINVIVHPDYMRGGHRLRLYRELLEHLRAMERLWIAKPSEVAAWVRGNDGERRA
jgi:peptidoglycan/xylan/chitin deacetylase (PgdA/CDA1 family)